MQNDTELWHKNCLSEEGTGVGIYDSLKRLNELYFKDRQDIIAYYQNVLSRLLVNERDVSDVSECARAVENHGGLAPEDCRT